MSIGSVSTTPAAFPQPTASVAAAPSRPAGGRDSDGDNDGSGTAAAAGRAAGQGHTVNFTA